MGVVVPKNIPMKMAAVRGSYELEHLKNHANIFEKGSAKKIYLHLHKMIKGEDLPVMRDGKNVGPLSAPGQKIKVYDFSKGKIPQEFSQRGVEATRNQQRSRPMDIEKAIRDVDGT